MPASLPPLPRRVVIASLAAGTIGGASIGLAGCDVIDDALGGDDPGSGGATAPPADADSTLVDRTLLLLTTNAVLARSMAGAHPELSARCSRFARLLDAHGAELTEDGTTPQAPPTAGSAVPGSRVKALRVLDDAEGTVENNLIDAAQEATSGALAQTLASMAAAYAQHRARFA